MQLLSIYTEDDSFKWTTEIPLVYMYQYHHEVVNCEWKLQIRSQKTRDVARTIYYSGIPLKLVVL